MAVSPPTASSASTAHLHHRRGQTLVRYFLVAALGWWWSLNASSSTAPLWMTGTHGWTIDVGEPSRRQSPTSAARTILLPGHYRRRKEATQPASTNDDDVGPPCRSLNRRAVFAAVASITLAPSWRGQLSIAWAESVDAETSRINSAGSEPLLDFANRNRNGNRDALIREDYWYMLGRTPPRLLTGPIGGANDPQWNAFGSCRSGDDPGSATGPNPCTYVSLNLRIPAYNRYASSITYGARQYGKLGSVLQNVRQASDANDKEVLRLEALDLLRPTTTSSGESSASFPSPIVDAELKLILFATAMTTSPNFPQPSRELLIARYYANEVHFADRQLLYVLSGPEPDVKLAMEMWEYGRDSWNSYFQIVNQHITAKVGDPFELV